MEIEHMVAFFISIVELWLNYYMLVRTALA